VKYLLDFSPDPDMAALGSSYSLFIRYRNYSLPAPPPTTFSPQEPVI
jgi:hypothetical protein